MFTARDGLLPCLEFQVALAVEMRKPLFLHCRDAADRFISVLQEHDLTAPAVAHCFTGSQRELQMFLDMGLYIGITGWVRHTAAILFFCLLWMFNSFHDCIFLMPFSSRLLDGNLRG